jgi:multidrug transporter EmrE-like cation transporter
MSNDEKRHLPNPSALIYAVFAAVGIVLTILFKFVPVDLNGPLTAFGMLGAVTICALIYLFLTRNTDA